MNGEELKKALLDQSRVEAGGIEYKCVSSIIYKRNPNGSIRVLAELQDKRANSVTVIEMSRVNLIEEKENEICTDTHANNVAQT